MQQQDTLSNAPFSFAGIIKRYVLIFFNYPNESVILLSIHSPTLTDIFSNELLMLLPICIMGVYLPLQ